jgi:hypothetical protein
LPEPRDGFVFATTGERYTGLARRSAANLRQVMPEAQIDLFTDQAVTDTTFDRIHPVTPGFFRPKMEALANSRFDRTVYLDADVIALTDVSEIFDLLDRFDIAGAHTQYRNTVLAVEDGSVPDTFPQINGGVLAVKHSPAMRALMVRWEEIVRETKAEFDQPGLRRLLWESDLRLAVLPMEYNFKCMNFIEVIDGRHLAPRLMHITEVNATEKWKETGAFTLDELLGVRRSDQIRGLLASKRLPETDPAHIPPLFRKVYALAYPQYYLHRYSKRGFKQLLSAFTGQNTSQPAKDPEAK